MGGSYRAIIDRQSASEIKRQERKLLNHEKGREGCCKLKARVEVRDLSKFFSSLLKKYGFAFLPFLPFG